MIRNSRPRMTRPATLATIIATAAAVAGTTGAATDGPPEPRPEQTPHSTWQKPQKPRDSRTTGQRRQIASSVIGQDLKFTLTAVRSRSDPLAATVRLRVLTFQNGGWKESDRTTVGEADGWFWFPVTGRHAVCEFSTAGTEPAPVAVSLLITPSIGCSPTESFQVEDGRIVPG